MIRISLKFRIRSLMAKRWSTEPKTAGSIPAGFVILQFFLNMLTFTLNIFLIFTNITNSLFIADKNFNS